MEETLGKRISVRRKALGLTQDALAEQLGITAQAVSKWENDLSCPDISILPKLADIFDTSVDTLLGREQPATVCKTEVITEENQKDNGFTFDSDSGKMDFHWEGIKLEGIGLACWVLLSGLLYLLVQFLPFTVTFWNILWPTFILVFGLFGLYPKFSVFRLGCALFGGYIILSKFHLIRVTFDNGVLIAAAVILLGLGLLADSIRKAKRRNHGYHINCGHGDAKKICHEYHVDGAAFSYEASFGDYTQLIDMEMLHCGSINVSFGDYTVDLRNVAAVDNGCTLSADCSFGELTILVPHRYTVIPDNSTSFASFEIKGQPDATTDAVINLQASVSFGEICVKYI